MNKFEHLMVRLVYLTYFALFCLGVAGFLEISSKTVLSMGAVLGGII